MTRGRVDAQRGRDGALLSSSPDKIVDKILPHAEALCGFSESRFKNSEGA